MLLRKPLLWASRSNAMRKIVEASPFTKPVVDRFIPAADETNLMPEIQQALDKNCFVTLDYLGEDVYDAQAAQQTVDAYLTLFKSLKKLNAGDKVEVSVKLSALGQALPVKGDETALKNAKLICAEAKKVGTTVTLDMEDHTTTDSTLNIARELRKTYPWVGIVLQAYLKRTVEDCKEFNTKLSRVRLCKGAYQEPESVAYQSREDINQNYLRCAKVLLEGDGYPMFATHDPAMIGGVNSLVKQLDKKDHDYEFQMLYGIRPEEQLKIASAGKGMRIYMAYGGEWYGYFMRRLAEKPANLTFFARSLFSKK